MSIEIDKLLWLMRSTITSYWISDINIVIEVYINAFEWVLTEFLHDVLLCVLIKNPLDS